jgi:hypothetical protein
MYSGDLTRMLKTGCEERLTTVTCRKAAALDAERIIWIIWYSGKWLLHQEIEPVCCPLWSSTLYGMGEMWISGYQNLV